LAWLHAKVVYPPEDGHPSWYKPGSTLNNFVRATNDAAAALNRQPLAGGGILLGCVIAC